MERFNFISTQEIDSSIRQGIPDSTRRANTFATHVYDQWVSARNAAFPDNLYPSLPGLLDVSSDTLE